MISVEKTIIDLEKSTDADSFEHENLIYYEEFKLVEEWIKNQLNRPQDNDKYSFQRQNNAISVFGRRGCGKTTFLLTLKSTFDKNNDIQNLGILDPTLIEEKGHIFLTILSLIKDSAEEEIRKQEECICRDKPECGIRATFEQKLKKLARGIPSLDHIGKSLEEENWQDPKYILDKGLQNVSASRTLEKDFSEFVRYTLKHIFFKKAFLIFLDDIDIDFSKGWPVLETIRKYFTFPEIIVIISGDERLFSKSVRKKQWGNFGKALLKNEGEVLHKMEEYNNLVTEMESQYLQKVLKPKYQIHLRPLSELNIGKNNRVDNIFIQEDSSEYQIINIYKNILKQLGVKNAYQQETYIDFLLSMPLRSQVQFLIGVWPQEKGKSNYNNDSISSIFNIFIADLAEKKVNYHLLRNNPYLINSLALQFLLKEDKLFDGYQMQPISLDYSFNACAFVFTLFFNKRTATTPFIIFDYMIRIGLIRNLYVQIQDRKEKESEKADYSINEFIQICGLYTDKISRNITSLIGSYLHGIDLGIKVNEKINKGVCEIESPYSTVLGSYTDSAGKIDFQLKSSNASFSKCIIAYIPAAMARHFNQGGQSFYSIYNLIAVLCELVRRDPNDIKNTLNELSQYRAYFTPQYGSAKRASTNDEQGQEIDLYKGTKNDYDDLFFKKMEVWANEIISKTKPFSIHLLGKISTRMYYAFPDQNEFNNLGEAFHQFIIILLNSIFVEEIIENNLEKEILINRDNPKSTSNIFEENILKFRPSNYSKNKAKHNYLNKISDLSLFKIFAECPLIQAYINMDSLFNERDNRKYAEGEQVYIKKNIFGNDYTSFPNIYEILSNVNLKGKKVSTQDKKTSSEQQKTSTNTPFKVRIGQTEIRNIIERFIKDGLTYKELQNVIETGKSITERYKQLGYDTSAYVSKSAISDLFKAIEKRLETCSEEEKRIIEEWKNQ
jgi:hypothetical protein